MFHVNVFSILLNSFTSPIFFIGLGIVGMIILSKIWNMGKTLLLGAILGGVGYLIYLIYSQLAKRLNGADSGTVTEPTLLGNTFQKVPVFHVAGFNYAAFVMLLIAALVFVVLHVAIRKEGYSWPYLLKRFWLFLMNPSNRKGGEDTYTFLDVVIGTKIGEAEPGLPGDNAGAGKSVSIKQLDRFLNTGIIGVIGSGKTYMTMKPMILQDIEGIAQGVMGNIIWISPQPEPSVEKYAEKLGLTIRRIHLIDGQVGSGTNIRFNPLAGDDVDSIINNVNVVLNEAAGNGAKGDAFFDIMAAQATTDSLQLYKYLYGIDEDGNPQEIDFIGWYDEYLVQMDNLFYDAQRIVMITGGGGTSETRTKMIEQKIWPKLSESERNMLRRAALSIVNEFGGDTTGKNAEAYKNIIRGLRGKVRVLISSQYVQELLGREVQSTKDRPNFSFEKWIDPKEWIHPKDVPLGEWKQEAPHGHKGELLSVITGQTDTGKLVGRMILVFLQQAVLNRPGKDNDKPPVYTYVDEYPSYATKSINEIRTQGRKHCHSMTAAMQSRVQLEEVKKGYLETFEGSCRHWVYLSNLGKNDAENVSELCGIVKKIEVQMSERKIRYGGLGKDDGSPLINRKEQEKEVARFSANYIRYELGANEVIYVGVENRKGQNPTRMRINEPKENLQLVKKLGGDPEVIHSPNKKPKRKKKEKIHVYPDYETRIKVPIISFKGFTLYRHKKGISVEREPDFTDRTKQYDVPVETIIEIPFPLESSKPFETKEENKEQREDQKTSTTYKNRNNTKKTEHNKETPANKKEPLLKRRKPFNQKFYDTLEKDENQRVNTNDSQDFAPSDKEQEAVPPICLMHNVPMRKVMKGKKEFYVCSKPGCKETSDIQTSNESA